MIDFDANVNCPKCWGTVGRKITFLNDIDSGEHLEIQCPCGFIWNEKCKDNRDNKREDSYEGKKEGNKRQL